MAPVDRQVLPGDPRRLGTGQEPDGGGHVLDGADAADGHLGQVVVEQRATGGDEGHQLVVHDARLDGVDPDPGGAQLLGGVPAQHVDAGLGRSVGPEVAVGEAPGPRGHPDDRAARCLAAADPGPHAGRHQGGTVLDAEEGADQVEVHGGPDLADVGLGHRPHVERSAGAGEEDLEPAPLLGRHPDRLGDLVLDGDVGHHVPGGAHRVRPRRGHVRQDSDRLAQAILGAPADGDVGAVGDQARGGAETDAAAPAGHQRREPGDTMRTFSPR